LDGIPLALELAAARVSSLPAEGIAARLDDRFKLLIGGPRTALPRQQTLRAALDWSHDLLSLSEQVLLRRLAVFAGGWTLEAAEGMCADEPVERWEILDLLSALVNKSLVLPEDVENGPRYRFLETVRQYARERLEMAGETAQMRDRHLAWCLALAEQAEPALVGAEQEVWLGRLEAEHDNVRAALAWVRERSAVDLGLRLAGALWRFWSVRGYLSEGRQWLEAALAGEGAAAPEARAQALYGAGNLASSQGDHARSVALHEKALALWRELGNRQGIAGSLNSLGNVAYQQGDYMQAAALYEESLALKRELGDKWSIAAALNNLGAVASEQGDYARAAALLEESLVLKRELGDKQGIAASLNNLGNGVRQQGDYARAAALHAESLALKRELGDKQGIAYSLHNLADVAYLQGDYARAAALAEESLMLRRELEDKQGIANSLHSLGIVMYMQGDHGRASTFLREAVLLGREIGARWLLTGALEVFAWVMAVRGHPERAAQLGGAAESQREILGVPLPPEQRTSHDRALQAMRATLREDAFAAAWAEGRALSLDQAINLVLSDTAATT
jgi:tetratricopeptide (TPR) repeat protein